MASRNGGGTGTGNAQDPIELSSDSESDSYAGSDHHDDEGGVCEYRSARYNDQECERYFDCPSHVVERVGEGEGEDVEMSNAEEEETEDSPVSDDTEHDADAEEEEPELPATPRREDTGRTVGNPIVLGSSPVAPRVDVSSGPSARRETPVAGPSGLRAQGQSAGRPDFVLPRWQPDAEVTYCPICHTQFSIWVRKHHCRYVGFGCPGDGLGSADRSGRKCGRVVCNACSPHRITIPYQYIVQPPWVRNPGQRYSGILGIDASPGGELGVPGGGESVRLCNPCVPDPNIAPPPAPGAQWRSQTGLQDVNTAANARWSSYFGGLPVSDAHARSRSVTMVCTLLSLIHTKPKLT